MDVLLEGEPPLLITGLFRGNTNTYTTRAPVRDNAIQTHSIVFQGMKNRLQIPVLLFGGEERSRRGGNKNVLK